MEIGLDGDKLVIKEDKLPAFCLHTRCPKCGYGRGLIQALKVWQRRYPIIGMFYCPGNKPEEQKQTHPVAVMMGAPPINNRCHHLVSEHIHRVCSMCKYEWFMDVRRASAYSPSDTAI